MADHQFEVFTRHAAALISRRGSLAVLGATAMATAAPWDPAVEARKNKNGKKRKRKCKRKDANQPERLPTCEEHCFPDFPLCFTRTSGPPLCANGAFTDGDVLCDTDQQCLGDPDKPYCLVSVTTRETGTTDRFTTCEPYTAGCCISVIT